MTTIRTVPVPAHRLVPGWRVERRYQSPRTGKWYWIGLISIAQDLAPTADDAIAACRRMVPHHADDD
ncbi:MAG: hypothetical protein AB7L66_22960, partial [Gemmatimonadales bacterium]